MKVWNSSVKKQTSCYLLAKRMQSGYYSYGFLRWVVCLEVWIGRSMLLLMCFCVVEAKIQAISAFGIRTCGAGWEIKG